MTNEKKKIILLALVAIIMAGCDINPDGSTNLRREDCNLYRFDSCEYIAIRGIFSHKGNCKFCAERRKQELKQLVKELKE